MQKNNENSMKFKKIFYFISSLGQCFIFGIVFIMCIYFLSHISTFNPNAVFIYVEIFSPALLAILYCYVVNRKNFHYNTKNIFSKSSILRLIVRVMSVVLFLFLGYYLDAIYQPMAELNLQGTNGQDIAFIIRNFSAYLIIATFPFIYAITEYLFVESPF